MSGRWFFPDNTVLINFAVVNRLAVLKCTLRGRGRWTEAVRHEALESAKHVPYLHSVESEGWLGEAIAISDPDLVRLIERVRRARLGGSPSQPRQHLGEAQTCCLLTELDEYRDAAWISDDRDALDLARHQGIHTLETCDVIQMSVSDGDLTPEAGFSLLHSMAEAGRSLRLPDSPRNLTS